MELLNGDVLSAVRSLGKHDKVFQSREIRMHLGIEPSDRNATARLYNIMRTLQRDRIIEVVPGERKRNKYFRLVNNEPGRQAALPGAAKLVSRNQPGSGAADRLTRMEGSLSSIDERLTEIENNIAALLSIWG